MLRTVPLFAICTITALAQAQESDGGWIQDFAAAKAKAKAENKSMLVDFTGSDWCHWCQLLDKEVFAQEAFQKEAPQHYVLVKLDYPRNKELVAPEIREQNEQLQKQYAIRGYPTILLMDADGAVIGATGYQKGGAEAYNQHLAELQTKGNAFVAALARAKDLKGTERAQALAAAAETLPAEMVESYHMPMLEEILALDADGKAGLKDKYAAKVAELREKAEIDAVMKEVNAVLAPMMKAKERDKAIAALDEMLKAPKSVVHHQVALYFRGAVRADPKAAIVDFEAAQKVKPESSLAKTIEQRLPSLRARAEKDSAPKDVAPKDAGAKDGREEKK